MGRLKHIIIAATILSFFFTLSSSAYNWVGRTFFSDMKTSHPTTAAALSHIVIFVSGAVILSLLGFLFEVCSRHKKKTLEEREKIQKQKNLAEAKEWFEHEISRFTKVKNNLFREVEIELQHYEDCSQKQGKQRKGYDWNRWDRIAIIADMLREATPLYNLQDSSIITENIKSYFELSPISPLLEAVHNSLDRIHEFLRKKEAENVAELNKAHVLLEDIDMHVKQIRECLERLP